MHKVRLWRGLTAVMAVVLSLAIFMTALLFSPLVEGQVNIILGIEAPTVDVEGDAMYIDVGYEMSKEGLQEMLADSDAHDIRTMEEGSVLLKNDGNALPLASTERRVTLFGRAVADPVYKGRSGGAMRDPARLVSLYDALKGEQFVINDTLFDAYKNSSTKRVAEGATGNSTGRYETDIGEETAAFYTQDLQKSYENDYHDVAIVMFARETGEGADLSLSDKDGISQLALHPQEADLLKMIKNSNKFGKIIALINSAYPMELGWLYEEEYGVDAALWIGGTGLKGFAGVANILVGKADPSGRLVDTYAADSLSGAAVQNAASFRFANSDFNRSYLIEAEGIYAGYKYYETRYQDQVLDLHNATSERGAFASKGNWDYADEMIYTFGYGTSYAQFKQEIKKDTNGNPLFKWDHDTHRVSVTVTVTNLGVPEGNLYTGKSKSVVELYAQLPWEEGQAEKSAIQLIGFGKTGELAKNESEDVIIDVDDYLFATYDENAKNGADATKKGCYVFDAGDYYFAIGSDAHDALNNVLAARGKTGMFDSFGTSVDGDAGKVLRTSLDSLDNTTYARSRETGNVVSNLFEKVNYNYWVEDAVTYLTRSDWETFPKAYTGLSATTEMIAEFNDKSWDVPSDAPSFESIKQGTNVTIKFVELKDFDWEDERWDIFLNQLTIADMCKMVGENFGQNAIKSVGKPLNKNCDGPSGTQNSYLTKYGGGSATQHVNEIVAASTWSEELLEERGKFIACDCAFSGTTQIWGPGANLHRTPFSGRSFEYYSEDSILSYYCGAYQTLEAQKLGCNVAIKHFAGNDQETGRQDMHNFMTEQKLRQDPLKGFEGAYTGVYGADGTDGAALASMMSYTSFGMQGEFYTDKAILTDVVRGEWGWKGVNITDNVGGNKTMNGVEALVAGTDTFNAGPQFGDEIKAYLNDASHSDRGYVLSCLRQANKRFFYAMSRSNVINGLTLEMEVAEFTPWWKPVVITVCCVIGAVTLGCATMYVLGYYVMKKKEGAEDAK